VEFEPQQADMC